MMVGNRCPICNGYIRQSDTVVRVVVEIVKKTDEDGPDDDYWSGVEDWDLVQKMHLSCARNAILKHRDFPYEQEVRELALFELDEIYAQPGSGAAAPQLKVVEGGRS